jgi:hypothetical protein
MSLPGRARGEWIIVSWAEVVEAWSGRRVGVVGAQGGSAQGLAAELDAGRGVQDSVADGVGQGGVAEVVVPGVDR